VGRNGRDMWVKVDDEGDEFGFAHLGFLADMVRPTPNDVWLFTVFPGEKSTGNEEVC
jgi:hypothetical protein